MNFRLLVASVLFVAGAAHATKNVFSMEQPFANRTELQQEVVKQVERQLEPTSFKQFGCLGSLEENLEGSLENFGGALNPALLVKPQGMCLCGVDSCVVWIFRKVAGRWVLAGELAGHTVELVRATDNRVAGELRVLPGGASETTVSHYRYRYGHYKFYRTSKFVP